jgi:ectoine hydroxylase-related dioxygenase (phytanoyl-CoA dioxygenase family)
LPIPEDGHANGVRYHYEDLLLKKLDLTIRTLANDPIIGEIAAALAETDAIHFWADQLLYKPEQSGGHGSNVGWHQDYHYWGCFHNPETLLTAWVAYDDVDEENGCLQMVPRSNQWGILKGVDFFEQNLGGNEGYAVIKQFIGAGGKDGDLVQGSMFPIINKKV